MNSSLYCYTLVCFTRVLGILTYSRGRKRRRKFLENDSWNPGKFRKSPETILINIILWFFSFLQGALAQLIQYYHRFQKILSHPPFSRLACRSELINIHHVMVEVKKHKTAFWVVCSKCMELPHGIQKSYNCTLGFGVKKNTKLLSLDKKACSYIKNIGVPFELNSKLWNFIMDWCPKTLFSELKSKLWSLESRSQKTCNCILGCSQKALKTFRIM